MHVLTFFFFSGAVAAAMSGLFETGFGSGTSPFELVVLVAAVCVALTATFLAPNKHLPVIRRFVPFLSLCSVAFTVAAAFSVAIDLSQKDPFSIPPPVFFGTDSVSAPVDPNTAGFEERRGGGCFNAERNPELDRPPTKRRLNTEPLAKSSSGHWLSNFPSSFCALHELSWRSTLFIGLSVAICFVLLGSQAAREATLLKRRERVQESGVAITKTAIRQRARVLKVRAASSLGVSIAIIGVAAFFVYYAEDIVSNEAQTVTPLDDVTEVEARYEKLLRELESELSEISDLKAGLTASQKLLTASIGSDVLLRIGYHAVGRTKGGQVVRPEDESRSDENAMRTEAFEWIVATCMAMLESGLGTRAIEMGACERLTTSSNYVEFLETEQRISYLVKGQERLIAEQTNERFGIDGRPAGAGPKFRELTQRIADLRDDLSAQQFELERKRELLLEEARDHFRSVMLRVLWRNEIERLVFASNTAIAFLDIEIDALNRREGLLAARLTQLDTNLTGVRNLVVVKTSEVLPRTEQVTQDRWVTVATAFTRFTVLLLSIWLVQIFVGLYRYSLRLAAFYDSCADVLEIGAEDAASFGAWIETLTPNQIDFGRAPATPPEQLVRMMQAVQGKSSSGQ
ncbi:hypothetical protein ACS3SW_19730 [Roseobacteraceae bacterium S113]